MANGTLAISQIQMLSQAGSGLLTINPPATNTNRTVTLPDSTGTLATAESTLAQFNASGAAPVYAARAWVNFNGVGTVSIRSAGNVTSITDNNVGNYTVNFTTAMPDTNYTVSGGANDGSDGAATVSNIRAGTVNTTSVRVVSNYAAAGGTTALFDYSNIYVVIHR